MRSTGKTIAIALVCAAFIAGCASSGSTSTTTGRSATTAPAAGTGGGHRAPFAWLHPAAAPPAWPVAHLKGTAAMAYPSGWQRVHSDPGTVTAARTDPHSGLILDYLNATPQQGEETLLDWASFRPAHNRQEGERDERLVAAAQGLRFRNGHGSCVIDRYRTAAAPYQEIACLVRGPAGATVIVAAAPVAQWAQAAPALERAVSAFLA